jgi:hypothetical protein
MLVFEAKSSANRSLLTTYSAPGEGLSTPVSQARSRSPFALLQPLPTHGRRFERCLLCA